MIWLTGAVARLTEALAALGRFTGKVDAILTALELEGFIKSVAEDTAQYTLGLVKSHFPEADLEPIGDGMAPNTSDVAWSNYLADARPIVERVATDLHL